MKTFTLVLLLLFVACENEQQQPVTISKVDDSIVIRNNSAIPIYYAAFDRELVARMDWSPFCGDSNMIQPSKATAVSVTDPAFSSSSEIIVYWWSECVQEPGSSSSTGRNLQIVIVKNQ
jgi:hypothetical protein